MEIPFALAFTAGLVATVNPCGFAMLPAYLSYFIGLEDGAASNTATSLRRALTVGAVVSAGFLAVFGVAGALITVGIRQVVDTLPWAAMVVGIGIAILGVAMLFGYELRASLPKLGGGSGTGLSGVFTFGISYAIASLSCTLPVFLVVVAGTIPQLGFLSGLATFLVYGLGMSTLLLVVTFALALGKRGLVGWLRRSSQHVGRIAGVILVVAGGYIVLYWATTLAGDGTSQLGAVVWVERLSSRATNWLTANASTVGIGALAVIAAVLAATWWYQRRPRAGTPQGSEVVAPDPTDTGA